MFLSSNSTRARWVARRQRSTTRRSQHRLLQYRHLRHLSSKNGVQCTRSNRNTCKCRCRQSYRHRHSLNQIFHPLLLRMNGKAMAQTRGQPTGRTTAHFTLPLRRLRAVRPGQSTLSISRRAAMTERVQVGKWASWALQAVSITITILLWLCHLPISTCRLRARRPLYFSNINNRNRSSEARQRRKNRKRKNGNGYEMQWLGEDLQEILGWHLTGKRLGDQGAGRLMVDDYA